ncbi:CRISPR-associated helicase/endonuclease Cas3 [Rhabdobacter roseus]|uniref:CRISPR-associated endonuclease/helicase Cas3 n=1 Tax=Rhabdobacter roseus TaxID=1655419 RepID=A0A840TJ98_9BACT|nr:CRISPR-associated helicase Cas3' [Rhabdobacter roseus]MBB5283005.1 CRISPR-associated endonuclease/helicase Cas3 [Rhabdobacter roseus]
MSNSYKTVADILKATPPINDFLIDSDIYYAHISPKNAVNPLPPETLQEHIELVQKKFELLTEKHGLDRVIDNLIRDFLNNQKIESEKLGNFLKRLFVNTVVFHDFGKINENFQASPDKMNNPHFRGKEKSKSVLSTHHSSLGAYLFIVKHIDEARVQVESQYNPIVMLAILMLSYPIFKHHGKYLNDEYKDKISFTADEVNSMKVYVANYQYKLAPQITDLLPLHLKVAFEKLDTIPNLLKPFSLYSLVRLSFSLLTASDYLASGQYMTGIEIKEFGVLSLRRINELFDFVSTSSTLLNGKENFNKATYQQVEIGYELQNPTNQSNDNLNLLRKEMALEVIRNIRTNSHKNLFYIEAPTGGGKTNLSMLAAVELLKASEAGINKVFYVFPFTTLITQTYTAIKDTLGLSENEVVQLHSKAGYKQQFEEEQKDGVYSDEKKNYIDNLFVNYPFCLLSHVKFFDLLKTNEKEANYMLHRLANSIVVIDELQSYDPAHWDKMLYFITHYAKLYNIKFILMSATLPKLGNLQVIDKEYVSDFVYLLPNAKRDYFLNPNFSDRVKFNFDLFERADLELAEIATTLLEKSKKYATYDFGQPKPKGSVFCIIEFIFKKSATEFYGEISKINDGFFDEILLLSGTILEHRRKEIINLLKNPDTRKKRVLLITTQVVEAGVDIDMDLGFKDRSMIDSEEQLAGRINRNVNKKECTLYLFNYNKERIIYGQDLRYQETKKLKTADYQHILSNKDFDFLYNSVFAKINFWDNSDKISNENHNGQLKFYRSKIENLHFKSVHWDFKIIEQNNISCFIPLDIPIEVEGVVKGVKDIIFSKNELTFLKIHGIEPNHDYCINGAQVFNLYVSFIQNKREFVQQKIGEKILQGIMSNFIFSLFATKNLEAQIIHFSDEFKSDFGYKYIEFWKDFYDVNFGMDGDRFNSNETQFL